MITALSVVRDVSRRFFNDEVNSSRPKSFAENFVLFRWRTQGLLMLKYQNYFAVKTHNKQINVLNAAIRRQLLCSLKT